MLFTSPQTELAKEKTRFVDHATKVQFAACLDASDQQTNRSIIQVGRIVNTTEAMWSKPMTEPKFKVGDLVRHLASGERGVVKRICTKCAVHSAPWTFVPICVLRRTEECRDVFSGHYDLCVGFDRVVTVDECHIELVMQDQPQPIYGHLATAGEKLEQGDAVYWDMSQPGFVVKKPDC